MSVCIHDRRPLILHGLSATIWMLTPMLELVLALVAFKMDDLVSATVAAEIHHEGPAGDTRRWKRFKILMYNTPFTSGDDSVFLFAYARSILSG
jgi:hypothetical protein